MTASRELAAPQSATRGKHLSRVYLFALAAIVGMSIAGRTQAQPMFAAPFNDGSYTIIDLGAGPGAITPYGGLTLLTGDPNTLLIGDTANQSAGRIVSIGLVRGASNHITGFSGSASFFANVPGVSGNNGI